jgi:hypothetical protein
MLSRLKFVPNARTDAWREHTRRLGFVRQIEQVVGLRPRPAGAIAILRHIISIHCPRRHRKRHSLELDDGPRPDRNWRKSAHAVDAQGCPVAWNDQNTFGVPLKVEVRRPHTGPRNADVRLLVRANNDGSVFARDEVEDPHRFVEAHFQAKRVARRIWNR